MKSHLCSLLCFSFKVTVFLIMILLWMREVGGEDLTRPPHGEGGPSNNLGPPPAGSANRYTPPPTRPRKERRRSTPIRMYFEEDCDYLAYYCLRAYKTGAVCGRTLYYRYQNFTNYCMLDYVNCMERYEVWQVAHMGECVNVTAYLTDYLYYSHIDDHLLEQYYLVEE